MQGCGAGAGGLPATPGAPARWLQRGYAHSTAMSCYGCQWHWHPALRRHELVGSTTEQMIPDRLTRRHRQPAKCNMRLAGGHSMQVATHLQPSGPPQQCEGASPAAGEPRAPQQPAVAACRAAVNGRLDCPALLGSAEHAHVAAACHTAHQLGAVEQQPATLSTTSDLTSMTASAAASASAPPASAATRRCTSSATSLSSGCRRWAEADCGRERKHSRVLW